MRSHLHHVVSIACALLALPPSSRSQTLDRDSLAREVRQEFVHAWRGYKTFARGHDELKPLTKSFHDWYSTPFLMTALDALDTMILMGLTDEADNTREYLATHLSFDRDVYVKNFEFTIRFLGGLQSVYQLTGDRRFLLLAEDLASRLFPVFNSPTGMPYVEVNLRTGAVRGAVTNPAEIGSLLLEFGTLSKLTGNQKYYDAAKRAVVEVYRRRSAIGLVGQSIDITTGTWVDADSHIGGMIDSYYEYLLKSARLFGDQECKSMWQESLTAINTYLADSTATGFWYGHANMISGTRSSTRFGSLDAFFPAVLAMSGDLRRAALLEEACLKMWNRYGIEPEEINYNTMEAVAPEYYLRPEIIESAYYLYNFTHDPRYLEMGKTFFGSLKAYCRTEAGYAELKNVRTKMKNDAMQSYFLAETLKYLYLLFAPAGTLDFDAIVFNTEAHPLRRTW
jgi:ER degradation enhancer, mannosidase alpha-like 2